MTTLDTPAALGDDEVLQQAYDLLLPEPGPRAAALRERFWFSLAHHARDGGCTGAPAGGGCPTVPGAAFVVLALAPGDRRAGPNPLEAW